MRTSSILISGAVAAVAVAATASAQTVTTYMDLATPSMVAGTLANQTVAGRAGVRVLQSGFSYLGNRPVGSPASGGWGMQASSNQAYWTGGLAGNLADITGFGFDYSIVSGSMGGGFRINMYVYNPAYTNGGWLLFDLTGALPGQTVGQWYSTGNFISLGSVLNGAKFSPEAGEFPGGGSQPWGSGYATWQSITGTYMSDWSVASIYILNDTGTNSVAIDNFFVSVPAPGAVALLGAAGLVGSRRRRS